MAVGEPQFGHFYCGLYVESICIRCDASVAKAATRSGLIDPETTHRCAGITPLVSQPPNLSS
jgi:hypothetical protein